MAAELTRPDLEESVLGTMIMYWKNAGVAWQALQEVWGECWTASPRAQIAAVVADLYCRGEPLDLVTVEGELAKRKQEDALALLKQLPAVSESADVLDRRARELRDVTLLRVLQAGARWAEVQIESGVEAVEAFAAEYAERISLALAGELRPQSAAELAKIVVEHYNNVKLGKIERGVPTGMQNVDRVTGGLPFGTTCVLGGRPSHGKSAIACWITGNVAMWGNPVVYFSHEPTGAAVTRRIVCQKCRISYQHANGGRLNTATERRFVQGLAQFAQLPIQVFEQSGSSPLQCRAALQYVIRHRFNGRLPLVVVDYLQLEKIPGFREDLTAEVAEISNIWLATFKRSGAAGLLLAQLNRGAAGRAPQLADLKQSGAIEQDAAVVMLVYRPGKDDEKKAANYTEVSVAKNRDGDLTVEPLHFTGYCMAYRPWTEADQDLTRGAMSQAEKAEIAKQTADELPAVDERKRTDAEEEERI